MQTNIRDLVQNWEYYRDCRAFVEIKLPGEDAYNTYVITGVSEIIGRAAIVHCVSLSSAKQIALTLDDAYPIFVNV